MSRTSALSSRAGVKRVEGEAGGIGAVAPAMTCAPVRSPQIFSCSMAAARNVSPAASITVCPRRVNYPRELADGRCLAGAVNADDENDMGAFGPHRSQRLGHRAKRRLDLVGQDRAHRFGGDLLVEAAE